MTDPGEWYVWHENAKYAEYGQKVLTQLLNGTPYTRKNSPFEVKVRKNDDDATFKVYARYTGEAQ